ncbi:MAG TPA: class I adenylate-forming enzyme family protein [Acidimicrobiales bacterium]|nr:class I adenylate-forming enzyme family protein [Acidimicrobiales bacterium]
MTSAVIEAADGLELTVGSLLAARTSERPDQVLLAVDDARLTYAEAERRSAELARALLGAGAGWGTRVGILHPNGPEFVVAWLAAARIGALSVPLSTFSTSAELVGLLRGADVALLVAAAAYRSQDYVASLAAGIEGLDLSAPPPLLSEATPSLRRVVFDLEDPGPAGRAVDPGWTLRGLLAAAPAAGVEVLAAAEAAVSPADRMVIVHTSGSTSEPKGVIHTHGALIRHQDNLNQLRRYVPGEILFSNSPFFWIGGFAYALLGTLVAGATLVCSNAPTGAGVLDVLERERPTMVNGFAASVAHVAQDPTFASRDLSSIRRGNLYPIMPAAVRPADPELHHNMLGMTEAGSVCLASDDESEQPEHRRGSFGRPVPGFEMRVRAAGGRACAPGEVGELCFRGPFLMEGYDGREHHETFDADEWYRTGDLVTVDGEGFVYFRGRSSDMIKTAGANVSPREVEAAILEVAGLVAHVVGLDDPARGQIVAALIRAPAAGADDTPGDGTAGAEGGVDLEDLRARLRERLSGYKVPKLMVVVAAADVPMMSSGKIDQRALKELLARPGAPR